MIILNKWAGRLASQNPPVSGNERRMASSHAPYQRQCRQLAVPVISPAAGDRRLRPDRVN